jgi:hypothetical protein
MAMVEAGDSLSCLKNPTEVILLMQSILWI